MTYNNWKLMDVVDVAVKQGNVRDGEYTGYVVEHCDKNALQSATDWATMREHDPKTGKWDIYTKPKIYAFKNEGFKATILQSAGGSYQGGRLSFWQCEVEKDDIKFKIGVNDAMLADLVRNSTIVNGEIQEKLMFARKGGQPGLIHKGMEAYEEATADMRHKAKMKKAKKTQKWEIGGVYSSITKTDICLGEVWDLYEEYEVVEDRGYWSSRKQIKLRKAKNPIKVIAWTYRYHDSDDFKSFLNKEFIETQYSYFETGKPPARAKTGQLEVTEESLKLLDKILADEEFSLSYEYGTKEIAKGRYVRELNG